MQLPDLVNGAYESLGGLVIYLSIRRLRRDKQVKGIHWGQIAFFMTWGWWNLFYYPHLGQWVSFFGGLGVVVANTVWLVLVAYYGLRPLMRELLG